MRSLGTSLLLGLLVACTTEPSRTNPFDEKAPKGIQAKATLEGSVVLELTSASQDMAGVEVRLVGQGRSERTDAQGSYRFAEVAPGTYSLQAEKAGWESAGVSGVVVTIEDGESTVQISPMSMRLARGTVSGRVLLEQESSNAGVVITLAGVPGSSLTDESGRFSMSGVPAGTYSLSASKGTAFHSKQVADVVVGQGAVTEVGDLQLLINPGTVTGQVTLQGATLHGGIRVRATGTTLAGSLSAPGERTTEEDGTFALSAPAGVYSLSLSFDVYD